MGVSAGVSAGKSVVRIAVSVGVSVGKSVVIIGAKTVEQPIIGMAVINTITAPYTVAK